MFMLFIFIFIFIFIITINNLFFILKLAYSPMIEVELNKYLQDPTDPDDQIMVKFFDPVKIVGKGAFSVVLAAFDKLA